MKRFLFLLFCMALFVAAKGQSNYTEAMQQGDDAFNKQQYKTAISKYFAAEAFDPTKKDLVKARVNRAFDAIESLRKKAEDALADAKKQTRIAQANSLISEAKTIISDDPTLALRLVEEAIKLDNVPKNVEFAAKIYRENKFYKIIQAPAGNPFPALYPWIGKPAVAFARDGQSILTGTSNDSTARLWGIDGKPKMNFKASSFITSVAISPDGKLILTGSMNGFAQLWSIDGKPGKEFRMSSDKVLSVGFSPDSQTILTGYSNGLVELWSIDCEPKIGFAGNDQIWNTSFSEFSIDGKTVLSVSGETARLFTYDGQIEKEFKVIENSISPYALSPDGQSILMIGKDSVYLLDTSGKIANKFKTSSTISAVAFSPDGKTILTGLRDGMAEIWNLKGVVEMKFKGHSREITSVAFSPDGRTILTGSLDRTARLWDLNGNIKTRLLDQDKDLILESGFQIPEEYGYEFSVVPFRALFKKMGTEFSRLTENTTSIAISPDRKTILTGPEALRVGGNGKGADFTGRLWYQNGTFIQDFKDVSSVGFSSDGKTIISFNYDGTVNLWNVTMPLNDFLKSDKIEPLTAEQRKQYGITEYLTPVHQK